MWPPLRVVETSYYPLMAQVDSPQSEYLHLSPIAYVNHPSLLPQLGGASAIAVVLCQRHGCVAKLPLSFPDIVPYCPVNRPL